MPIRDFDIPAWNTAGLHQPISAKGRIIVGMTIGRHLRRSSGAVSAAVLAPLADGCLGLAIIGQAGFDTGVVTSHLHMEFPNPSPRGLSAARCSAAMRSIDGSFGLAEAVITDGDGTALAFASLGGILVPRPTPRPSESRHAAVPTTTSDIDALISTAIVSRSTDGASATFRAWPELSNLYQNVHGGLGTLMGVRTLDAAVEGPGIAYRLADLRAVFTRSIPAGGDELHCRAAILHRGRRVAAGSAELIGADGRIALRVDATYVATADAR